MSPPRKVLAGVRVHVWLCGEREKSAILIAPPPILRKAQKEGGTTGLGGGVETIFVLEVFKLTARLKGVWRVQETPRHIHSNS